MSHASQPHLNQTNGKFRNKQTAGSGRIVGTEQQQNTDCPVQQQSQPEATHNESTVLHFGGCGQPELAGIIWILLNSVPTHSLSLY